MRISIRPLVLLLVAAPCSLAAQVPGGDSIAPHPPRPVAAWASLGFGSGAIAGTPTGLFAGAIHATVSVGPFLAMYRDTDVGPFLGSSDGVRGDALMIGARTAGRRLFASAALGYDRAKRYHECMEGCQRTQDVTATSALAYDISAHANEIIPGLALSFAGALGSSHVRYSSVILGVELGWFGR